MIEDRIEIGKRSIPILLAGIQMLQEIAESIFTERIAYTSDNGADQMVLSFVTKQIEHMKSVRILIRAEAHRDAQLIARTMLEGYGQLAWVLEGQPERTDRWLWFGAIVDRRQMLHNRSIGVDVDKDEWNQIEQLVAEHGDKYIRPKYRKAQGEAIDRGEAYMLPDDPWDNTWYPVDFASMFCEIGEVDLYESSYRGASEWIHWGTRAILRAAERADWGTSGFSEVDWPAASLALSLGCHSVYKTLTTLDEHFTLGRSDQIVEGYRACMVRLNRMLSEVRSST
jgi:hypothetical protein